MLPCTRSYAPPPSGPGPHSQLIDVTLPAGSNSEKCYAPTKLVISFGSAPGRNNFGDLGSLVARNRNRGGGPTGVETIAVTLLSRSCPARQGFPRTPRQALPTSREIVGPIESVLVVSDGVSDLPIRNRRGEYGVTDRLGVAAVADRGGHVVGRRSRAIA